MPKFILTPLFILSILTSIGQSYLGLATKKVNFRSGPGTEYETITSINQGAQLFIVSLESENDFYNVIDIESDREGYIHKSYITVGEKVRVNEDGVFTTVGKSNNINPQVEIYNNTSTTMTLKLNNDRHTFSPYEKKTLTSVAGKCSYRASSPGVIPAIGVEQWQSNMVYSWEFYIVTERK
jgi:uncharacterized protein YgiM (DUF1202 family)